MAKIWTILVVLYGLLALCAFAGIPLGYEMSSIDWKVSVAGLMALCVGFGVVVGSLTKTSPDIYIAASFATSAYIPVFFAFIGVINYAQTLSDWIYYLTAIIFGVLSFAYLIAAVDWVLNRGSN